MNVAYLASAEDELDDVLAWHNWQYVKRYSMRRDPWELKVATEPIKDYIITDHATVELERRGLSAQAIDNILKNPDQRMEVRAGRVVVQSRVQESGAEYLVRVFVDIDRAPAEVVTAYRTSKVLKYWRDDV